MPKYPIENDVNDVSAYVLLTNVDQLTDVEQQSRRPATTRPRLRLAGVSTSIRMSMRTSMYMSMHLSVHMYVHMPVHISVHIPIHKSIHTSPHRSSHKSLSIHTCMSTHILCTYL